MHDKQIADTDHVARYCKKTAIAENGRPTPKAFMLRENEAFLSVNWLEYYRSLSLNKQLDKIRKSFPLKLTDSAKFATINVGKTKAYVKDNCGINLSILHEPSPKNKSHAGIHGYRFEDDMTAALIAEMVQDVYPGVED